MLHPRAQPPASSTSTHPAAPALAAAHPLTTPLGTHSATPFQITPVSWICVPSTCIYHGPHPLLAFLLPSFLNQPRPLQLRGQDVHKHLVVGQRPQQPRHLAAGRAGGVGRRWGEGQRARAWDSASFLLSGPVSCHCHGLQLPPTTSHPKSVWPPSSLGQPAADPRSNSTVPPSTLSPKPTCGGPGRPPRRHRLGDGGVTPAPPPAQQQHHHHQVRRRCRRRQQRRRSPGARAPGGCPCSSGGRRRQGCQSLGCRVWGLGSPSARRLPLHQRQRAAARLYRFCGQG